MDERECKPLSGFLRAAWTFKAGLRLCLYFLQHKVSVTILADREAASTPKRVIIPEEGRVSPPDLPSFSSGVKANTKRRSGNLHGFPNCNILKERILMRRFLLSEGITKFSAPRGC